MSLKMRVVQETILKREKISVDPRMMSMEEITSVNSVTRRILAIPPYIHIWNKSIQRAQMEKQGLLQLAEEVVEDLEKM
jgi:hypothetical protein